MSATASEIARAAAVLRAGGLVAFPTETVYGLGADATSEAAVRRLYAVKRRPPGHPVIVHLGDADALREWARAVPDAAAALAAACWPGPLTLLVERSARVADVVTGGRATVGLRVPDQPLARELLRTFGGGVAAPSANRFGRVSPTTAADVEADLGDAVDLVLDGGPCRVGVESTIVDCSGAAPVIRRLGGVTRERVEQVVGTHVVVDTGAGGGAAAPGTLESHYAPRARVVLTTSAGLAAAVEREIAAGARVGVLAPASPATAPESGARVDVDGVVVVGAPATVDEYAHSLYSSLRAADAAGVDVVVAVPPPEQGLGAAVADRLRRAAAPRDGEGGGWTR